MVGAMGDYRKLFVWQRARVLVRRIQQVIAGLPPSERNVRGQQLRRAATGVRYSIAEGAGLNTDRLFAKHLRYALGSANEVQDELDDLHEQGLLLERDEDLLTEIAEIRAMTASLLRTVTQKRPPKRNPELDARCDTNSDPTRDPNGATNGDANADPTDAATRPPTRRAKSDNRAGSKRAPRRDPSADPDS